MMEPIGIPLSMEPVYLEDDIPVSRNLTAEFIGCRVFKKAQEQFRDSLAPKAKKEFQTFCNANCLVEYLEWQAEMCKFRDKGPLATVCHALNRLGQSLQPYFGAINSVVSSNPEISGIIWGAFQLVFKLCHNYSTFLEKFAFLLTEIATELEVFQNKIAMGVNVKGEAVSLARDLVTKERIIESMSQLYQDLLQLCQYVCNTFSNGQRKREKMQNIAKMLWTPFDKQFGGIKERLILHRQTLETAIIEHTAKTVEKTYNELDRFIQEVRRLTACQEKIKDATVGEFLEKHVEYIKAWINPPMWQSALEDTSAKKLPSTSNWILRHSSYLWWREDSDPSANHDIAPKSRTLLIHGKPGFGKSTLCTTVINQLSTRPHPVIDGQTQNKVWDATMAFYMFDKRVPDVNNSTSAMRAVLAQLLYQSQFRLQLVDLAIILKDVDGSGQPIASTHEVHTLLQFFLETHPAITLVFDGLDECQDVEAFMNQLSLMSRTITSRILLFSRPNVTLDINMSPEAVWAGQTRVLDLNQQENLGDITIFFKIGLGRLVDSSKLFLDEPLEILASDLAFRSHSMFIWASLMVNYLESDFLSPQDREDALHELSSFEELDELYAAILNGLYKGCKGPKARKNFRRLIQWVSVAQRPLHVDELCFALAIEAGTTTKPNRLINGFVKRLPKITGALLEITPKKKTVQAIHVSVLEFLAQTGQCNSSPAHAVTCDFDTGIATAEHQVAVDCLSYMLFDVPRERSQQEWKHVFLRYVAHFWVSHAAKAIEAESSLSSHPLKSTDNLRQHLLQYLNQYMKDRLVVTVWIELSWRLSSPPDLRQLADIVSISPIPSIQEMKDRVKEFTSEIEHLKLHWGRVLQEDPGEIWEPSISAFMKPQFFLSSDKASVTELGQSSTPAWIGGSGSAQEPSWILIASQSSNDGAEVGWIKVWPSKAFNEMIRSPGDQDLDAMSRGWAAIYDIKQLADKESTCHIELELPAITIRGIVEKARLNNGRFEFPVAFSPDLRQITILNYLVRVLPTSPTEQSMQNFSVQCLNLGSSMISGGQPDIDVVSTPWYHIVFSPNSRYIAVLRGPMKPSQGMAYKHREIIVFEDAGASWETPKFQFLAQEHVTISHFIEKRFFTFHPTQPALAIALLGETNLWFFKHPVRWYKMPFGAPLDNLSFSKCGWYLSGTPCGNDCRRNGHFRMIPISKYLPEHKLIAHHSQEQYGPINPIEHLAESNRHSDSMMLKTSDKDAVLPSESIAFENVEGHSQISMLRQLNEKGAVTLQQFRDDGTMQSQCFTRLPLSSSLEQSYATLIRDTNAEGNHLIQLVINKAMEDTYECDGKSDLKLPLLICRDKRSVPTWTGKHRLMLEQSEDDHMRPRKRLS